jgi:hypothetical protein
MSPMKHARYGLIYANVDGTARRREEITQHQMSHRKLRSIVYGSQP